MAAIQDKTYSNLKMQMPADHLSYYKSHKRLKSNDGFVDKVSKFNEEM